MENFEKSHLVAGIEYRQGAEPLNFNRLLDKQIEFIKLEIEGNPARIDYSEKMEYFMLHTDTLDLMETYWRRFRTYDHYLNDLNQHGEIGSINITIAQKPLLYLGKMTAVLANTVGLAICLQNERISDDYTEEACKLVRTITENKVNLLPANSPHRQLSIDKFKDTKMGLKIDRAYRFSKQAEIKTVNYSIQKHIVLETANAAMQGLLVWQAYVNRLNSLNIKTTMPKPGISAGISEIWESDATRIFE